jgi:hypothetical protein
VVAKIELFTDTSVAEVHAVHDVGELPRQSHSHRIGDNR